MHSDWIELLARFNDCRVKYLVIGGHAFIEHAEPRYTKDLDLWIEPSLANARRVFKALAAFGAPLGNLGPADFARTGSFYTMGRPPLRVDILMSVKGLDFKDAWKRRALVAVNGHEAPFISIDDLLKAKLLSGRPQDLIDAQRLQEVISRRAQLKRPSPKRPKKREGGRD